MRAMYYERFGETPEVRTVADPSPTRSGVVIEVKAAGLCRSDWHGWKGHDPDIHLPHVPGHEFAGVIAAVGSEVKAFRPGDRVTVPFVSGLRPLPRMPLGQSAGLRGAVPARLHPLGMLRRICRDRLRREQPGPAGRSPGFATAASLGCRFATSFRAVVDQGRLRGGEWLAVHGCGGVGLSAIMIGAALGANVVAIDIAEDKLDYARRLGASVTLNSREIDDIPAP